MASSGSSQTNGDSTKEIEPREERTAECKQENSGNTHVENSENPEGANAQSEEKDDQIDLLSKALEESVQAYGQLAIECAPHYFNYGNALLQQIEKATGVLGEQLKKKVALDEEEQKSAEGESDESKLAWENLEVARVIYEKHVLNPENPDSKHKPHLAEVYTRIADLSMETENFAGSYEDYTKAVNMKKEYLSSDDRDLAGTHSALACVSLYLQQPTQALAHYKDAANVFKHRLLSLYTKLANVLSGTEPTQEGVMQTYTTLESLYADIKEAKSVHDELLERIKDIDDTLKANASTSESPFVEQKGEPLNLETKDKEKDITQKSDQEQPAKTLTVKRKPREISSATSTTDGNQPNPSEASKKQKT